MEWGGVMQKNYKTLLTELSPHKLTVTLPDFAGISLPSPQIG